MTSLDLNTVRDACGVLKTTYPVGNSSEVQGTKMDFNKTLVQI